MQVIRQSESIRPLRFPPTRCLEQIDPIGLMPRYNISLTTFGFESNSFHLHFCNHRLNVSQFYRVQLRSTSLKDMAAIKVAESITEPGDAEKFGLPTPLPALVLGWFEWLNATLDD